MKCQVATIWLGISPQLSGYGYLLARVDYIPDGRGYSGDEKAAHIWNIEASEDTLSPESLKIAESWYKHRDDFKDADGLTDEPALRSFLAAQLGIVADDVQLPYISLKPYTGNRSDDTLTVQVK